MLASNQLKNQHLLWWVGFGPAVEQLNNLTQYGPKQFYGALVKSSSKKPEYFNVADNYLQGLVMGIEQPGKIQQKELSPEEKNGGTYQPSP